MTSHIRDAEIAKNSIRIYHGLTVDQPCGGTGEPLKEWTAIVDIRIGRPFTEKIKLGQLLGFRGFPGDDQVAASLFVEHREFLAVG